MPVQKGGQECENSMQGAKTGNRTRMTNRNRLASDTQFFGGGEKRQKEGEGGGKVLSFPLSTTSTWKVSMEVVKIQEVG